MKIPVIPPDVISIVEKDMKLILKILKEVKITDNKGRYLHWDKLRYLETPGDFSNEQWWAAMKLNRQNLCRQLPFKDKKGKHFSFCMTDMMQQDMHWLDVNAAGTINFDQPVINNETRNTYLIKSLVEESIRSSQLEGATTTKSVAKEMIRQRRAPKDRSEHMIMNNYDAMEFIRECKDENLTPEILFELHRIITDGTLEDSQKAGLLRDKNDRIYVAGKTGYDILHIPPKAEELKARIDTLCNFANQQSDLNFIHPVIRAIILHFMLAYDHPFVDGNGRTARALFYWAMIKQGYWLTEFISISRIIKKSPTQYSRSFLYTETDESDITYFLVHQLEVIKEAISDLYQYLKKKSRDIDSAEAIFKDAKNLNAKLNSRQLALLRHALKNPRFVYRINEHQNSHNIAYDTARRDLLYISDRLKLLNKLKQGKEYIFISPPDLGERIKKH